MPLYVAFTILSARACIYPAPVHFCCCSVGLIPPNPKGVTLAPPASRTVSVAVASPKHPAEIASVAVSEQTKDNEAPALGFASILPELAQQRLRLKEVKQTAEKTVIISFGNFRFQ
jgi:hypothetical protein